MLIKSLVEFRFADPFDGLTDSHNGSRIEVGREMINREIRHTAAFGCESVGSFVLLGGISIFLLIS